MKRIWLGTLLAVFVFTLSVGAASAATRLGSITKPVHTFEMGSSASLQAAGQNSILLIARFQPSNDKNDKKDDFKGKDKDRGRDKDKFHGAEMSSTAIVIAGLLAISAHFLFVRRKSHTRA